MINLKLRYAICHIVYYRLRRPGTHLPTSEPRLIYYLFLADWIARGPGQFPSYLFNWADCPHDLALPRWDKILAEIRPLQELHKVERDKCNEHHIEYMGYPVIAQRYTPWSEKDPLSDTMKHIILNLYKDYFFHTLRDLEEMVEGNRRI